MAPELPQYWHFSRSRGSCKTQIAYRRSGELEFGYFSVEDTARLMQGFVPERKDRRVIDIVPC
jgi:hypothetical protein